MVFCELPVTQLSAFAKDEEITSEYTNNDDAVNDVVSANTVSANDSDNVLVQDEALDQGDVVGEGDTWLKILDSDEIRYTYSGECVQIRYEYRCPEYTYVYGELIGSEGDSYCDLNNADPNVLRIIIGDNETAKEMTARFRLDGYDDIYIDIKLVINKDVKVSGIQLEKANGYTNSNIYHPNTDIEMYYIVESDIPYASLELIGNTSHYTSIRDIRENSSYDGRVTFKLHIDKEEEAEKLQIVAKAAADADIIATKEFFQARSVERVDITLDDSIYCVNPAVSYGNFMNAFGKQDSEYIKVEAENINYYLDDFDLIYYRKPGETEWKSHYGAGIFDLRAGFDLNYEYAIHIELHDLENVLSAGDDGELDFYLNGKKIKVDNNWSEDLHSSFIDIYVPLKPFEGVYTHGITIKPYPGDTAEAGRVFHFDVYEYYADLTRYNDYTLSIESPHSDKTYFDDSLLRIDADEVASEMVIRVTSNEFPERYDECTIKITKEPLRITKVEPVEPFDHVTKGVWNYIPCTIEGNANLDLSASLLSKDDRFLYGREGQAYFKDDCLCVYVDDEFEDNEITVYIQSSYGYFNKRIPIKVLAPESLDNYKIEIEYEPEKLLTDDSTFCAEYINQLLDPEKGNLRIKDNEGVEEAFELVPNFEKMSLYYSKEGSNSISFLDKNYKVRDFDDVRVVVCLKVNTEANYTLTRDKIANLRLVVNGTLLDGSYLSNYSFIYKYKTNPSGSEYGKVDILGIYVPVDLHYHEHDITIVKQKNASCDRYGCREYYWCTICDKKFTTSSCEEPIKDFEKWKMSYGCIAKQKHILEKGWRADNTGHWLQCANCKYRENVIKHTSAGPATDTEDEKCTECQYIITPAKGHVHEAQLVPGCASTCVEEGRYDYYECKVCKHFFEDAECTKEILNTYEWLYDKIIIPFAGHTGGTASCMKKAVCDVCGQEYGELAEHNIITVNEIPATCVENGRAAGRKCQVCGVVISGFEEKKAKAHFYDAGRIIKEPTYTEEGQILYTCLNCNDTKLEKIDKLLLPKTDEIEISAKEKIDINNIFAKKYPGIKIDKFVSSDKKVASVNKKGIVSGKKGGIVSISAMQKKGKEYDEIASIIIVVKSPKLEKKYSINYLDEKLELGKELKDIPKGKTISWDIVGSKKDVAEIDANGVITAKKNGSVKVVCMIGEGKTAAKLTTKVIVKTPVLSIKDNMKLKAGKRKIVTLKNVAKKAEVKWEVSDKNVLEIPADVKTSKIQIKGVNPGIAVLKASVDGHEYTATIVVE